MNPRKVRLFDRIGWVAPSVPVRGTTLFATTVTRCPKVRFASDSLLEGDGFEPSVPREHDNLKNHGTPNQLGAESVELTSNPGGIIDAPAHNCDAGSSPLNR